MKKFLHQFIVSVRREAKKRGKPVSLTSRGRRRVFHAYDWGRDTFIFEESALEDAAGHQPILLVRKSDLLKGSSGYVMTVTTGNHAVAAVPLLTGEHWNLGRVPSARRNAVLLGRVICANLVDGKVEVSQRDVPTALLVEADEWLQGMGFPLDTLVMAERNHETLDHYRRLGQEWRVKPLAWTQQEMRSEIARSGGKRINSSLRYYHSVKGVHFLSYAEFHALLGKDDETCVKALHELVSVSQGQPVSYLRTQKVGGHHEVELFGVRRGEAVARDGWVSKLEYLMQEVTLRKVSREEARESLEGLDALFKSSLERPGLADAGSADFIETLYMHLTGAVYEGEADALSLAFDGRRTALPGATYCGGRPAFHPGADERTRVLLSSLGQMVSQNEVIEYANIYELRTHDYVKLGDGVTREIEFKTNRRPLCTSMIEKRLKLPMPGYGSYLLARVHAFKALGVNFGEYRLLERTEHEAGGEVNHFLRDRYPGDSLDEVPARLYRKAKNAPAEDPDVVLAMGALLGDVAAQNLVVKKFLPETQGCRFGEGKEIFEFAYGLANRREMPVRVGMCSVRGALGWPDVAKTEANLARMFDFYLTCYAQVLGRFWRKHRDAVELQELAGRFFDGFELKTREMHWLYAMRREQFNAFDPKVRPYFKFALKWSFALWALDCQENRLDALREMFMQKATAYSEGAR
ncbi:MAG: hypothetical protein FWG50_09280 [Kiritimatiellaeota bacterium]|nr:hypothetical protein [Kiritimatiellota bacterium]